MMRSLAFAPRCFRAALLLLLAFLALPGLAAPSVPSVRLWVSRDVAPGPKIRLQLNTTNVPALRLTAYKLDGPAWLLHREHMQAWSKEATRPELVGKPVRDWEVSMRAKNERPGAAQSDFYRSRQVNLPPLPPGIYLLTASGGGKSSWGVVNITRLSLVLKRAPNRLLAWVTDQASGTPVPGARVGIYEKGKQIAEGTTGADGVCQVPAAPGAEQTVIVQREGDLAGMSFTVADPDGVLKMHLQTDRPVYRPGNTVLYRAILRRTKGRAYTPVADTDCRVEVRDARDNVIAAETVRTGAMGTLSGSVELPAEGVTGAYSIVVTVGGNAVYGGFTVAEYRKPEFKVTVTPGQKRYLAGEKIAFAVDAAYYFGAPLPQAQVGYRIRRSSLDYYGDDGERWYSGGDGNLYPSDTYAADAVVAEDTVHTDENGKAVIEITAPKEGRDATYSIEVTVLDAQRRSVEASSSVPVYAAALRVGVQSRLTLAPLGSLIPVDIRVTDLDGRPAAARVSLSIRDDLWVEKEQKYRERILSQTTVNVPATGKATANIPALAMGDLRIVATALDGGGRKTAARADIWGVGREYVPPKERQEPELTVRLDRRVYAPGDTARVWVTNNTPSRPVLIVAEGGDIFSYIVVPKGRGGYLWNLKTSLAMSPNAQIAAVQWTGRQLLSAGAVLPLPDRSRQITVSVTPDRAAYKPGEPARYRVRTVDPAGKPVSAEVAVAVVDESIFAVRPDTTPDPYTFFWGLRGNLTETRFSAPEEVSGGAYQRNNALAPLRQQFLDTAHWDAHVRTGADGEGIVSFAFPGNLTTWRATAIAVTDDTRVGRTTAQVQVSRPVMLRLATPRRIVEGDRFTLTGTVHNRTDTERTFAADLSAEGLTLEGKARRSIVVPARSERTLAWVLSAAKLPPSGVARIEAVAYASDVSVEQRPEFSDALSVGVPVVPRGIATRQVVGASVEREKTVVLPLPADRIEPASDVVVTVRAGVGAAAREMGRAVLDARPWGSPGAAGQLQVASLLKPYDARAVRDSLALLSRYQAGAGGWGWWEPQGDDDADPVVTARIVRALAAMKRAMPAGTVFPENLLERGRAGAEYLYNETDFWEHRAVLAASLSLAGHKNAPKLLEEVLRRGIGISPYARLLLAEALAAAGKPEVAAAVAKEPLALAVRGPETAFVPAGERPGWFASRTETTAQALLTLLAMKSDADLQRQLAEWLARPDAEEWRSGDDTAAIAQALLAYDAAHPGSSEPGAVRLTVNGAPVDIPAPVPDKTLRIPVPRALLRDGDNAVTVARDGAGEAFVAVEATVYRPILTESTGGVRVLRRWETLGPLGVWQALDGPVKPSRPVRVTVLVWPDEQTQAIRLTQPIPAGFEFIDSERGTWGREEVRDGAIVHYFRGDGEPVAFRYYLRAESEGDLVALPAQAEALRRPSVRGNSAAQPLAVRP